MQNLIEEFQHLQGKLEGLCEDKNVKLFIEAKERIEEVTNEIKKSVKESNEDVQAGKFLFQLQAKYKKWIDYGEAMKTVGKENQEKLQEITEVSYVVDMKKFIDLCREGVFPDKARIKSYREEPLASSVLIKEQE